MWRESVTRARPGRRQGRHTFPVTLSALPLARGAAGGSRARSSRVSGAAHGYFKFRRQPGTRPGVRSHRLFNPTPSVAELAYTFDPETILHSRCNSHGQRSRTSFRETGMMRSDLGLTDRPVPIQEGIVRDLRLRSSACLQLPPNLPLCGFGRPLNP